jgi:hypothetical protein
MIYLISILLLLAGCAGISQPPQPDFHTMRQAQTIDLPGHSSEAITEAIVRVFTLADTDDVVLQPTTTGLTATRRIYRSDLLIFLDVIHEHYNFEISDGRAFMTASIQYSDATHTPFTLDVYDLFRSRIRHLLGYNEPWVSCDEVEEYSWSSVWRHPYLCLHADDHRPE